MATPSEVTLQLQPTNRFAVIDVNRHVRSQFGELIARHEHALYCSYHTTAGYLEQSLCARLDHSPHSVQDFFRPFQTLFPPDADYRHDRMELRQELSEAQRRVEPRNADSHLTFIGSGLENCVTYRNAPGTPVYFIDLDGVNPAAQNGHHRRRRLTTVIGYDREEQVERVRLRIPVSDHPIDSINLKDPGLGLFEQLNALLAHYEIRKGRIDIRLCAEEHHAGLTVNEDETLLMMQDLREVLRNPMRFMAEKSLNMLRDPRAIPGKAKNYAKYDLVLVVNKMLDKLGLSESLVERVIDKFLAVPAERFLRMKRSTSLLVTDGQTNGRANGSASAPGAIVQGRYQSPLLIQWKKAQRRTRTLDVTLVRFI